MFPRGDGVRRAPKTTVFNMFSGAPDNSIGCLLRGDRVHRVSKTIVSNKFSGAPDSSIGCQNYPWLLFPRSDRVHPIKFSGARTFTGYGFGCSPPFGNYIIKRHPIGGESPGWGWWSATRGDVCLSQNGALTQRATALPLFCSTLHWGPAGRTGPAHVHARCCAVCVNWKIFCNATACLTGCWGPEPEISGSHVWE